MKTILERIIAVKTHLDMQGISEKGRKIEIGRTALACLVADLRAADGDEKTEALLGMEVSLVPDFVVRDEKGQTYTV